MALAAAMGLVGGYPDGTFQLQRPATRAEVAVLLERLGQQAGTIQADVQGTWQTFGFAAVGVGTLTVRTDAGTETDVVLNAGARIFINSAAAEAGRLQEGDQVQVYTDGSEEALWVLASRATVGTGSPLTFDLTITPSRVQPGGSLELAAAPKRTPGAAGTWRPAPLRWRARAWRTKTGPEGADPKRQYQQVPARWMAPVNVAKTGRKSPIVRRLLRLTTGGGGWAA